MSKSKSKVGLVATDIQFNNFSIIYKVKLDIPNLQDDPPPITAPIFCCNSIKDKDLILKPTIFDRDNQEVIFVPSNVIPHFYQAIHDQSMRNIEEYFRDLENIYAVGDVVGYVLL